MTSSRLKVLIPVLLLLVVLFTLRAPFDTSGRESHVPPFEDVYATIGTGRWVKNARIKSRSSIKQHWGAPPTCPSFRGSLPGDRRAIEVSSYDWRPHAFALARWDVVRIAERFMNSPVGLVLVGDSVTTQTHEALEALLSLPSRILPFPRDSLNFTSTKDDNVREVYVAPHSPLEEVLRVRLPHVPLERFRQPFARTIRHDTLLRGHELRDVAAEVGIHEPRLFMKGWLHGVEWENVMIGNHSAWKMMKKDVLLFNTGAHWSRVSFGQELTKDELASIYSSMVRRLAPRLPATALSIFRTTAPAHFNCASYGSPLKHSLTPTENLEHEDWDWASFPRYNEAWKNVSNVLVLDVDEVAGRRADAHMVNFVENPDCLHWCLPAIPATFLKMAWTIVVAFDANHVNPS